MVPAQTSDGVRSDSGLAIAMQGSFGHAYYAMGIMAALQEYDIPFIAASGCVEMLLLLWLYFSQDRIDIHAAFEQRRAARDWLPRLISGYFDPGHWGAYWQGVLASLSPPSTLSRLLANFSGPAGPLMFNPFYFEGAAGQEIEQLMAGVGRPVFTNALDAQSFQEIYLYTGPLQPGTAQRICGKKGDQGKRRVERLNLARFCASGARPPLIAPLLVHTDGDQDAYWMEGAMRCNPPLNPLIDVGATKILLIRFFARGGASGRITNQADLYDRYIETIFTAPLEKELEFIQAMNDLIEQCGSPAKKEVAILDASVEVPAMVSLVQDELDSLSHYRVFAAGQWEAMFQRGEEVGHALVAYYTAQGALPLAADQAGSSARPTPNMAQPQT